MFCNLSIKLEQVRHNSFLVAVEVHTVGGLHRRIKRLVGGQQIVWHLVGVVQIGQRCAWVRSARIKHALRAGLNALAGLGLD